MYPLNVCLIVLESLRSDCSDLLVEKIENDNILFFPNTYPRNIPTPYSFTSILNGVPVLSSSKNVGTQKNIPTITETLKKEGYKNVGLAYENPFVSKLYGYERGFDRFYDGLGDITAKELRKIGENSIKEKMEVLTFSLFPLFSYLKKRIQKRFIPKLPTTGKILIEAFQKIKGIGQDFFLFLHLMDTHFPFRFPYKTLEKEIQSQTKLKQLLREKHQLNLKFHTRLRWRTFNGKKVPQDEIGKMNKKYYKYSIQYIGSQLNSFIRKIRERYPDTLFIITSDHGEGFGEHGYYGHSYGVYHYEEIMRVPLLLIHPSFKRKKIETNISLLDIVPTILEFADIEVPRVYNGKNVFNRNSNDMIKIESFPMINNFIFPIRLGMLPRRMNNYKGKSVKTLILNRWKFTVNRYFGEKRLIDLSSDPFEEKNKVETHPKLKKQLEKVIFHLERRDLEKLG